MEKVIIPTEECRRLIHQWVELNPEKLKRLSRAVTRRGYWVKGVAYEVMAVPPVLITPEGFILNGKHRICTAARRGYALEACVIEQARDLLFHTPKSALRDLCRERVLELYKWRNQWKTCCQERGICTIDDLLERCYP